MGTDLPTTETSEVTVADSNGVNKLAVNADGSINVNSTSSPSSATKVFGGSAERTGVGTTEVPVALFVNPSGSTKVVKVNQVLLINRHTVTSQVVLRCYVSPTVTSNGTAVTTTTLDVGSGNTATALLYQSPTVSANGVVAFVSQASGGSNVNPSELRFLGTFSLRAGSKILFTGAADGTSRIPVVSLVWEEI